jgi:hypothetical protein
MEARKRDIIEVFKDSEVIVIYRENNRSDSFKGVLVDWDMNYVYIVGLNSDKIIPTANIEAIKKVKGNDNS